MFKLIIYDDEGKLWNSHHCAGIYEEHEALVIAFEEAIFDSATITKIIVEIVP